MYEYKIIKRSFSWNGSYSKFEEEINSFASLGWRVKSIEHTNSYLIALLERIKEGENRNKDNSSNAIERF